jgi:hypothetical protein
MINVCSKMGAEGHSRALASNSRSDERLRHDRGSAQILARPSCAEAGPLLKASASRRIAPHDVVGVAESSGRILGMLERRDESRPDVAVLVIGAAGPQLDDQSCDPLMVPEEDPHDAML